MLDLDLIKRRAERNGRDAIHLRTDPFGLWGRRLVTQIGARKGAGAGSEARGASV